MYSRYFLPSTCLAIASMRSGSQPNFLCSSWRRPASTRYVVGGRPSWWGGATFKRAPQGGMMGYKTPNIDRIACWYLQQRRMIASAGSPNAALGDLGP